jgi:hypothetical protein
MACALWTRFQPVNAEEQQMLEAAEQLVAAGRAPTSIERRILRRRAIRIMDAIEDRRRVDTGAFDLS